MGTILQNRKKLDAFENMAIKVPFFIPSTNNDDSKAIRDALNKPLLTDGPNLRKFELMFSKFTGAKYSIGVSNGTASWDQGPLAGPDRTDGAVRRAH